MNSDKNVVTETILKSGNEKSKGFVSSSVTKPDGIIVMPSSNYGNISPKSDGNPAASPPILPTTKKSTTPRRSGRNRRSNSDIPDSIYSNFPNGGGSPTQWSTNDGTSASGFPPPSPQGMYQQQHLPHDFASSSWSGSYGMNPYHISMMGNMHYNNQSAGPPPFLMHPLASTGSSTHLPVPLPYPVEEQQGAQQKKVGGGGNEQREQNRHPSLPVLPATRVNDNAQFYNYPYPLPNQNLMANPMMYGMVSPAQQALWQQSVNQPTSDPYSGPSSLKPPFSQRPPSVSDNQRQRQEQRRHRKSLSSAAAIPAEYGSFWNAPTESVSSNQNLQQPPPPSYNNNNQNYTNQPSSNRVIQAGGSLGRNQGIRFTLDNNFATASNQNKGQKFSPRNELKKMFKELSPVQSQRKGNGQNAGSSLSQSVRGGTTSRILDSPNSYNQSSLRLPSPLMTSNRKLNVGGEAAIIFKGVPSRESSRKKHQRQQSAQLYMEQIKGVEQPLQCRNVSYLLLFVFHLLFVGVYLGERYTKESLSPTIVPAVDPEVIRIDYHNLVFVSTLSGGFAIILSTVLLALMTLFARNYLQISLFITIGMAFIWGTLGVGLSPKTVVPVTGIIALGFAVAYTFIVWDRIPFHSTNLLSALSGIRVFPTTVILATFLQIVSLAWCVYFSVVAAGFYNSVQENKVPLSKNIIIVCYFLFGMSFFWTYQVIHGCVKAATAGVIAGWWHTPDYSDQVRDSCFKTMFYSIGSICLGGLLIGPVTILRQLSILVRPSQSEPSLLCLHECLHFVQTCIFNAVDFLVVRCNDYSYAYIGIYHYGFFEAGYKATELFDKRGWTTIVSDDLVQNVLLLTSLAMGGITGCFAHAITQMYSLSLTSLDDPGMSSFVLGTVIGLVLSNIVFSVVSSAVNSVLICFASSPVDFETNHPLLSTEMREAWREVWPDSLDIQYPISMTDSDETDPFLQ